MKERKPMFFHRANQKGTGHFPAGKCPEKSCISTKKNAGDPIPMFFGLPSGND